VPIHKSVKSAWALSGVSDSRMRIFVPRKRDLRQDQGNQALAPIDAEIGQKDHSWMETI